MESQTILSLLKMSVQVNGSSDNVTITEIELVSECFLIGDTTSCNCSGEYSWSNEVCYSSSCCTETTCTQNVSHIKPLCVAKVQVYINGSVTLTSATWDANKTAKLETAFRSRLNGYESLNITGYSSKIADFEAAVSIKLKTSVLQKLLTDLDDNLTAKVLVDTVGMVKITAPEDRVCYKSSPSLKCRLEEATTSTGWKLIKEHKHLELENGSMVNLNPSCFDGKYKSCIAVTLNKVTSAGSGTYQCRFTFGSVTHTAKAQLNVSLLPEVITMTIDPPVADCSMKTNVEVTVTAKIQNTTESYNVSWELNGSVLSGGPNAVACPEDTLVYSVKSNFLCEKMTGPKWKVIFQNQKGQMKNESVDILVISENGKYCPETDGIWPKTPNGGTVINQTCENGKTGYKSRTCNDDSTWQPVFSFCISQKLQKVLTAAEVFKTGIGATPEAAIGIFEGLKNTTKSDSRDDIAEINASISVINIMATASRTIILKEEVFDDFLYAASNLLKNNWTEVNSSIRQDMSSQYLEGVEDLVKNIQVKNTLNISHQNLDLKVFSRSDCNISVFNATVKLNKNAGQFKTVGVRNLLDKFDNRFEPTSTALHNLIIIATLENSSFPTKITMDFPSKQLNHTQPHCVFWVNNKTDWSETGCKVQPSDANHTRCKCTHLTSFAVLMSKTDSSDVNLDTITYVGLAVSICSLLILLIIEALVWSVVVKTNLSYFRHTALVNIAVFLLLADCSFLASISPEKLSARLCLILTICKHVFYLATFSWMLCMSVMLIHRLIFVFSPLRKKVFMFLSSIVGYACPVLIVALSYVYCKYNKKRYYEEKTCWLVFEGSLEGSIYAFLLPVGTVIFTNLFSMAVVIFTLLKSSAPDSSRSDEKETAKSIIKVVLFLTPVFGVTWGIGFLLLIFDQDNDAYAFLTYSFTILNSFQGFFVMLTGVFAEPKVRQELLKRMDKGKYDTMKNSTSASNTKER
ncbi:adhesion G-protein coupled receptor F1-like isoform X2 [Hippoglossus hippoglossus]|uniref:adhesion G-protein coupled receptor F1-like isoform X1 n=1 Tax=Hippoglossus hippoglossus TaxID=8267 RepID=UPI00148CE5DF|nr:adhesion G-protein coupled receptor F1-like isoform X1 [Hippoglossus hippoglossus]XP_034435234.1 adhesion G-protein coupled receptor F1-like isoform X2 [Hippoglossus hippoglossus]